MRKRIREFRELMGAPITWGGYVKLCIACFVISIAYTVWYLYTFVDGVRDAVNDFIDSMKFWKKKDEASYEDEEL